jgi:DNA-binding NarL/FixJ family response regulator
MSQIRVLIADDHTVVRKGIKILMGVEPAIEVVGEAKNGCEAVFLAQILRPDVILMDLVMPQEDGIEAIAQIKRDYPYIKIIVLTTFEDEFRVQAAFEAGADGYLLKDADGEALLQAVQSAQQGGMPLHPNIARHLFRGKTGPIHINKAVCLTDREQEVLQLVTKGLGNKDVAQTLHLSIGTVKIHVSNILNKLNVASRIEAAMWAVQMGLISVEEEN